MLTNSQYLPGSWSSTWCSFPCMAQSYTRAVVHVYPNVAAHLSICNTLNVHNYTFSVFGCALSSQVPSSPLERHYISTFLEALQCVWRFSSLLYTIPAPISFRPTASCIAWVSIIQTCISQTKQLLWVHNSSPERYISYGVPIGITQMYSKSSLTIILWLMETGTISKRTNSKSSFTTG